MLSTPRATQPSRRLRALVLPTSFLCLSIANAGRAEIIHVPGDYAAIQHAIDAAETGDVIEVGPGTWHENIDFLGKGITVKSTAGAEETTIRSPHVQGQFAPIITCENNQDSDAILEGFRITGASGPDDYYDARGTALSVIRAAIIVRSCRFERNASRSSVIHLDVARGSFIDCAFVNNSYYAILIEHHSKLFIQGCHFERTEGPALYLHGNSDTSIRHSTFVGNGNAAIACLYASMRIDACTFSHNRSSLFAGAVLIWSHGGTYVEINDSIFEDNWSAGSGGAMYLEGVPVDVTMSNCVFRRNSTDSHGGAVYTRMPWSTAFEECVFIDNHAGYEGGAVRGELGYAGSVEFLRCRFDRNSAQRGGAIAGNCLLENGRFHANTATDHGGAVWGSILARNSTFIGNSAGLKGGAVSTSFEDAELANCAFIDNDAGQSGGGAANTGLWYEESLPLMSCVFKDNTPDQIDDAGSISSTAAYSCLTGGFPGEGNIDADPSFERAPSPGADNTWGTADDDYGDLRLRAGSPCIDAGHNSFIMNTSFDARGAARLVNDDRTPDTGQGWPTVDMGPFEYQADSGCGNGVCESDENCATCPFDCGNCDDVYEGTFRN